MSKRILCFLLTMFLVSLALEVNADECENPQTSREIAQCLGKELRESDAKINSTYKELMRQLDETDRANLRQAQRNWIKERDAKCQLDSKESNRERWYQWLLKDYAKTVCVTRYTRKRTAELEAMLAESSSQKITPSPQRTPTTPPAAAKSQSTYDKIPVTPHRSGKWYFEVTVDSDKIIKIEPTVIFLGVSNQKYHSGSLVNIHPRCGCQDVIRYGFAVDLDNGKLYTRINGNWEDGEPGSNLGQDLKLGRDYFVLLDVTANSIIPYLEQKAIVPNFGDRPMTYALPAGYRPWKK